MADVLETMFAREVDFRLEDTDNAYAACRALSIRARDINRRFHDAAEIAEVDVFVMAFEAVLQGAGRSRCEQEFHQVRGP